MYRLDQAPEVPLQCLRLLQLGVVHARRSQRHVVSRGGGQSGSGLRSRRPEAAEGEMLSPEAWLASSAAAAPRNRGVPVPE